MKKVFLIILFSAILLTGCSKEEEIICDIGATTVTVTVKNGKIISYNDKVSGDLDAEGIERLNESYLKDIKNNKDAVNELKDVLASMGANCK